MFEVKYTVDPRQFSKDEFRKWRELQRWIEGVSPAPTQYSNYMLRLIKGFSFHNKCAPIIRDGRFVKVACTRKLIAIKK